MLLQFSNETSAPSLFDVICVGIQSVPLNYVCPGCIQRSHRAPISSWQIGYLSFISNGIKSLDSRQRKYWMGMKELSDMVSKSSFLV
jgi:hypothetical protein